MPGKQNIILNIPTICSFSDTSSSRWSNRLGHGSLLQTTDVSNTKHQLSTVSTRLSKQTDNSQDNSTYNINLNEQYSRHNDINAKIIATTLTTNIAQDKVFT